MKCCGIRNICLIYCINYGTQFNLCIPLDKDYFKKNKAYKAANSRAQQLVYMNIRRLEKDALAAGRVRKLHLTDNLDNADHHVCK